MRSLALTFAAALGLVLFFALPFNSRHRISLLRNINNLEAEQRAYQALPRPQDRARLAWSENYMVPMFLAENLGEDDVFLIPPRGYLTNLGARFEWTDPRYMYYVAGPIRCVKWGEDDEDEATYALRASKTPTEIQFNLVDLSQPGALDSLSQEYSEANGP